MLSGSSCRFPSLHGRKSHRIRPFISLSLMEIVELSAYNVDLSINKIHNTSISHTLWRLLAPLRWWSRDVFRFFFSFVSVKIKNARNEIVAAISQNLMVILTHPFALLRGMSVYGSRHIQLVHRYLVNTHFNSVLCLVVNYVVFFFAVSNV